MNLQGVQVKLMKFPERIIETFFSKILLQDSSSPNHLALWDKLSEGAWRLGTTNVLLGQMAHKSVTGKNATHL